MILAVCKDTQGEANSRCLPASDAADWEALDRVP